MVCVCPPAGIRPWKNIVPTPIVPHKVKKHFIKRASKSKTIHGTATVIIGR